jgi:transposase-like protein
MLEESGKNEHDKLDTPSRYQYQVLLHYAGTDKAHTLYTKQYNLNSKANNV